MRFAHLFLLLAFLPHHVAVRLQFRHAIARVYPTLLMHLISVHTRLSVLGKEVKAHRKRVSI